MTIETASSLSKEEAKVRVRELVEKFTKAEQKGETAHYNEAQVRISFIDPLLRALGWNVESPEEVAVEEHGLRGYSDYALRLPGERRPRIFVEAKRIELGASGLDGRTQRGGHELTYPQQAIQYAWQTQAAWSVLTNFRETRLYSSYVDPKDPSSGLVLTIGIRDYEREFESLWLLSKESAASGVLDSRERRRARETIHVEAPADLFELRSILAKDIRGLNPDLPLEQVRDATQRVIDRLLVMRVAEDRGILQNEALWKLYRAWKEAQIDPSNLFVSSLRAQFQQFDQVYDSEMFAPGHVCDKVTVGNKAIEQVLHALYRYNFDLIDADILGSIYEGYLGFVLEEEKGEVRFRREEILRKRHGVYYTPTYVVEYIVDRTLGPALSTTDVNSVSDLRVLDPACGSGSFLIKAYDRLAGWYAAYNLLQRQGARGRVTLHDHAERKGEISEFREIILHQNLFGVDLDPQAAEIAAINLLLKALRKNQKLPLILRENVKVGNSLVSARESELRRYFGDAWQAERPLNWTEAFPFLRETGGFDVVLGNPPYVDSRGISEKEREYFHDAGHGRSLPFATAYKKSDLFALFLELGIRLLKPGGRLSFIIPDRFLYSPYAARLRAFILDSCAVEEITDLSNVKVFLRQAVWNIILVLRKEPDVALREGNQIKIGVVPPGFPIANGIPTPADHIPQRLFRGIPETQFRLQLREPGITDTVRKLESSGVRLDSIYYVNWGLRTGTEEKTDRLVTKDGSDPLAHKMVRGENIADRYLLRWTGEFIIYDRSQLYNPLFTQCLDSPKILVRKISGKRGLFASYDPLGYYPFSTLILVLPFHVVEGVRQVRIPPDGVRKSKEFDPLYVLAVINSRAMRFYFDAMVTDGLSVVPEHVNRLPVPSATPAIQKHIGERVQEVLKLRGQLESEMDLGSFRRILAGMPRSMDDTLSIYLARLEDQDVEVRNRLESVATATDIKVVPEIDGEWLALGVTFTDRNGSGARRGTVRLRLPGPLNEFILDVVRDLPKQNLGAGRPMARLRAIPVPRFDADWDKHLEAVANLEGRLREHRANVLALTRTVSRLESEIDSMIYRQFGLAEHDIRLIEARTSGEKMSLGAER